MDFRTAVLLLNSLLICFLFAFKLSSDSSSAFKQPPVVAVVGHGSKGAAASWRPEQRPELAPPAPAPPVLQPPVAKPDCGPSSSSSSSSSSNSSSGGGQPPPSLKYFRQAEQCAGRWQTDYAALHADIRAGRRPPRYFVSVAVEAGMADRLTGMITQFWLAVLQQRAFTALTYGDLPGFDAVCDSPHNVNWTTPPPVPDDVAAPLKYTYQGVRGFGGDRSFPASVNTTKYGQLYMINSWPTWMATDNLTDIPKGAPRVEVLLGASNRGRTFYVANNRHHKAAFWEMGVRPEQAFMCGFFFLCAPNAAVTALYERFWQPLQDAHALKIGIQVRIGDTAMRGEDAAAGEALLNRAANYFACAAALEAAFALPGQRVVWYLNADSHALRAAAKAKYGEKLLTDAELMMVHPDCKGHDSTKCSQQTMDLSFQHSLGSLITFSMTDYHIISLGSGFGRLGAWMSGRWDNIYGLEVGGASCDASRPRVLNESSITYSGVR